MSVTDEEFGRAWARQQGLAPNPPGTMSDWGWWWPATGAGRMPVGVSDEIVRDAPRRIGWPHYSTEAAAYAALGRAVRAVHAAVPPLDIAPGAAT